MNKKFSSDEGVIFCGTKKMVATLQGLTDKKNYTFINWGNIDGRNDLVRKKITNDKGEVVRCIPNTKMVFLSIPRSARNYLEQSALAMGLEKTYLDTGNISNYRLMSEASYISRLMGQAAARDMKRKVSSSKEDCQPCEVYMLFMGSKMWPEDEFSNLLGQKKGRLELLSQLVISNLQEIYTNAKWEIWESFDGFGDGKRGRKNSDTITNAVSWLKKNLKDGDSININDFILQMGLDQKQENSVRVAFRPARFKNRQLEQDLKDLNIQVYTKSGRNGYTELRRVRPKKKVEPIVQSDFSPIFAAMEN